MNRPADDARTPREGDVDIELSVRFGYPPNRKQPTHVMASIRVVDHKRDVLKEASFRIYPGVDMDECMERLDRDGASLARAAHPSAFSAWLWARHEFKHEVKMRLEELPEPACRRNKA